jgi:hypothetical protein
MLGPSFAQCSDWARAQAASQTLSVTEKGPGSPLPEKDPVVPLPLNGPGSPLPLNGPGSPLPLNGPGSPVPEKIPEGPEPVPGPPEPHALKAASNTLKLRKRKAFIFLLLVPAAKRDAGGRGPDGLARFKVSRESNTRPHPAPSPLSHLWAEPAPSVPFVDQK